VAQTRETMTNIKAVLAEANRMASRAGGVLKAVYLQADVCRQDLLLDIAATAAHPLVFMSGQRN
jgi:hypothetical protein